MLSSSKRINESALSCPASGSHPVFSGLACGKNKLHKHLAFFDHSQFITRAFFDCRRSLLQIPHFARVLCIVVCYPLVETLLHFQEMCEPVNGVPAAMPPPERILNKR